MASRSRSVGEGVARSEAADALLRVTAHAARLQLQDALRGSEESSSDERMQRRSGLAGEGQGAVASRRRSLPEAAAPAIPSAATAEERERQRVEQRMREAKARREEAEAAPCPLGEDLCEAAFDGLPREVRRLLDAGADVNYMCSDGTTPLSSAFYVPDGFVRADPAVVAELLARGADANAMDARGCTALHYAVHSIASRCVAELLDAGADTNAREGDGSTPLHWAASFGREEAVRTLLAAGADKRLTCWSGDWTGKTPLDVAEGDAVRDLLRL